MVIEFEVKVYFTLQTLLNNILLLSLIMSFLSNLTKPLESFKTWLSSPRKHKLVYRLNEGRLGDEKQLSRKGVGLCEISRQGFEVPSTFLIAADSALEYRR